MNVTSVAQKRVAGDPECNEVFRNDVTSVALLRYNLRMWRKLHILSPLQTLLLASVSAAIVAMPLAVQAASRQEVALLHNFFWPDALDPYILFSLVFMGLVPVLLGYYHLGRLGFLLSVALGLALAWVMAVLGIICFAGMAHYLRSVRLSTIAYATSVTLVYMLVARLHLKAARSQSVRDAQRKLRLVPAGIR